MTANKALNRSGGWARKLRSKAAGQSGPDHLMVVAGQESGTHQVLSRKVVLHPSSNSNLLRRAPLVTCGPPRDRSVDQVRVGTFVDSILICLRVGHMLTSPASVASSRS